MNLAALTDDWLTGPLGMAATTWADREQRLPDGTPFSGLLSTASDLARLGSLVIRRGVHDGNRLVSEAFIETLAKKGSTENPAWGLCWWNNDQQQFKVPMQEEITHEGPIIPAAPRELIAARGAMQNALYILPTLELVIARTAMAPSEGQRPKPFEQGFWTQLVKHVSQGGR